MTGGSGYAVGARRAGVAAGVVAALVTLGAVVGGGGAERLEPVVRGTPTPSPTSAPSLHLPVPLAEPRVVRDPLKLTPRRLADTTAYLERHAGVRTNRLDPRLVVLHYTESDTYESARSLFEANLPSLGEPPGTCAHYVVDQDGTIFELVPPTLACRHTVGLNHVAIGVEFVQASHGHPARWAAQQILARPAQALAGAALVASLQRRFAIPDDHVIGHAMANGAKEFRDLQGWRNDHEDWQEPEVERFRALLKGAG